METTTTVKVKTTTRDTIKKEIVGSGLTLEEAVELMLNRPVKEIREIINLNKKS